jgi:hypothetical protein
MNYGILTAAALSAGLLLAPAPGLGQAPAPANAGDTAGDADHVLPAGFVHEAVKAGASK